jgi:hypothetical protein
MDECITCDNLCDAELQTETIVTLARDLAAGDTEIYLVPNTVIPAVGYGLFNGCVSTQTLTEQYTPPARCGCRPHVTIVEDDDDVEEKYELIKYCGTRIESESGEVVLTNLVRGLPFRGCDDTISISTFIKSHEAGETIKIGSPLIHYYWCKMCECVSNITLIPGPQGEPGGTGPRGAGYDFPVGGMILWHYDENYVFDSNIDWLPCDGREVSRVDYLALYNTIGDKYGNGDGSTTFNLPTLEMGPMSYLIYVGDIWDGSGVIH